jgi:predicted RNA-binding Zn-ribbon protein involved in translation (DUF1610 family)
MVGWSDGSKPSSGAPSVDQSIGPSAHPTCQRCNFPVPDRVAGCKHPCPNCGTIYPLGDCAD